MAKMSFSSANRVNDRENFPKLTLEQNESARVVVTELPESAYVHNLRAPKLVNGVVQYKGEDYDYAFLGNPICLGDEAIIRDRGGLDVKNCPACAAAKEFPDMFSAPKIRYALHVYQYQTNGTNKAPANGEGTVKIWAFSGQKFGELVDIFEEAETEDPSTLDLILGPCENKGFQKFKIIAGQKTAWKSNAATVARYEEAVASNRAKDIMSVLGRKMSADFITDKIDEVKRNWSRAKGQSGETSNDNLAGVERNLDAGLTGLLDDPKPVVTPQSAPANAGPGEIEDFDDILKSLG